MKRRLFTILSAVSLLLFAAVAVVFWVRTPRLVDSGAVDNQFRHDASLRPTGHPSSLLYAKEQRFVVGTTTGNIHVYDSTDMRELLAFPAHQRSVTALASSTSSSEIASGGLDGMVYTWSVEGVSRKVRTFAGHRSMVTCIAFGPDDELLVTASLDGTVRVWNNATGTQTLTLQHAGHTPIRIDGCSISRDGAHIATASSDGFVRIWDVRSGEIEASMDMKVPMRVVAFSNDSDVLVCAGGAAIMQRTHGLGYEGVKRTGVRGTDVYLIDWRTGERQTLGSHSDIVMDIEVSTDGSYALSCGSYDRTVRLWSLSERKEVWQQAADPEAVFEAVFAPDAKRIATMGWDGTIKVWQLPAPKP